MKNLRTSFNRYLLLYISVLAAVFIVVFYIPLKFQTQLLEDKRHRNIVQNEAKILNYYTNLFRQSVAGISSRTMIRVYLYRYSRNEIDITELREYTQDKFEDGCRVHPDMIWAQRLTADGDIVASFGSIPDSIGGEDLPVESTESVTMVRGGDFFLFVKSRIQHEGHFIGFDYALFNVRDIIPADHPEFSDFFILNGPPGSQEAPDAITCQIGDYSLFLTGILSDHVDSSERFIRNLLFIFIFLIAVVLGVLTYFTVYRSGRRIIGEYQSLNTVLTEKEKQLSNALEEKKLLLKEMNHRVKNNLMMVSSLVAIKENAIGNAVDLTDLKNQIQSISLLHERLYLSESFSQVEMKSYIERLVDTVIGTALPGKVDVSLTVDSSFFDSRTAVSVGLIINELITNSIKHGLRRDATLNITVRLNRDDSGEMYVLVVSNDGTPIPEDYSDAGKHTLGLRLVTTLVSQLRGDFSVRKSPHPETTVIFPPPDKQG